MRHVIRLMLGFVVLASGAPVWAVNKCLVDGRTVYQDAPCAGGGKQLNIQANAPSAPTADQRSAAAEASMRNRAADHQQNLLSGMASGRPVVGMTDNQLRIAMGLPNRINAGDYQGQQHDQLIYERGDVVYYVYVRNGVVSSVQTSSGYSSAAPVRRERCPTAIEIRNMETSAKAASISEYERRELWRRVREAREACK